MLPAILDSGIVSPVMSGLSPLVSGRATNYVNLFGVFMISAMSRFELLRGWKAVKASAKLRDFETSCRQHVVLPVTEDVIVLASDLYAYLRRRGKLIQDVDLLIAATALLEGRSVVTTNVKHFQRIPGLAVENWLQP